MNVRKPTDYSVMFKALDNLMAAALPQVKLYCEIGKYVSARPERGSVCSRLTDRAHRTLFCNGQMSHADQRGDDNNALSTVHKREGSIPILPVKHQRNSWGNNGQYSFWQVSSEQYGAGPSATKPTSDIMVSAVAKGSPSAVEKLKGIFTANFLPCKISRLYGCSKWPLKPQGFGGFSIFYNFFRTLIFVSHLRPTS